jgi:hypothetical protein
VVISDEDLFLAPGSPKVGRLGLSRRLPIEYYEGPDKTAKTVFELSEMYRWSVPRLVEAHDKGNMILWEVRISPQPMRGSLDSVCATFGGISPESVLRGRHRNLKEQSTTLWAIELAQRDSGAGRLCADGRAGSCP